MSVNEMISKIKELKSLQTLIEEAEAEKVTYKTVTSSRFDSKSLKAELPEIAARYTIATEYRRLTVA